MDAEEKIAKVTEAFIGFEDHGLLTATVRYDYGSSGQGIGHLMFGREQGYEDLTEVDKARWQLSLSKGMEFIQRLLQAHGTREWSRLVGRTVLVTCTHTDIVCIRPLPTEKGEEFRVLEWCEQWGRDAARLDEGLEVPA